jgi:hypothetical protein
LKNLSAFDKEEIRSGISHEEDTYAAVENGSDISNTPNEKLQKLKAQRVFS